MADAKRRHIFASEKVVMTDDLVAFQSLDRGSKVRRA